MKIYSEKTKEEYKTVEECLEAEKVWDEEQEAIKVEREEKAKIKKDRAKEVEDAYKAEQDAYEYYLEKRNDRIKAQNKFIEDYGYFHMTYSNKNALPAFNTVNKLIDSVFRFW